MRWPFKKKKTLSIDLDEDAVMASIAQAESQTSGEIKVYIEEKNPLVDTLERAEEIFYTLEMQNTLYRNAVLMYIAYGHREYAIYGDEGIFLKHEQTEWEELAEEVHYHLSEKGIQEALQHSISRIGQWLSVEFPPDQHCSKNELPDEIVFGS